MTATQYKEIVANVVDIANTVDSHYFQCVAFRQILAHMLQTAEQPGPIADVCPSNREDSDNEKHMV